MKVERSALRIGRLYPQGIFLVLSSLRGRFQPQDHSTAEGLGQMKNSNDTIGNRTNDLPASSVVPHPAAPPRALVLLMRSVFIPDVTSRILEFLVSNLDPDTGRRRGAQTGVCQDSRTTVILCPFMFVGSQNGNFDSLLPPRILR